jgi:hypothetical protein
MKVRVNDETSSLLQRVHNLHASRARCMPNVLACVLWPLAQRLLDDASYPGGTGVGFLARVGGQTARFFLTCFGSRTTHMIVATPGRVTLVRVPFDTKVDHMLGPRRMTTCERDRLEGDLGAMLTALSHRDRGEETGEVSG